MHSAGNDDRVNISLELFSLLNGRILGSQSAGVDGSSDGAEEAEALLQVPDAGTGERVPVQRLRFQAETMGAGAQSQPDGAPSQNLVPEPASQS